MCVNHLLMTCHASFGRHFFIPSKEKAVVQHFHAPDGRFIVPLLKKLYASGAWKSHSHKHGPERSSSSQLPGLQFRITTPNGPPLSISELPAAWLQAQSFCDEIQALKRKNAISRCRLHTLHPFLDSYGLQVACIMLKQDLSSDIQSFFIVRTCL